MRLRREDGASAVEFALLTPLLVMLVFGIIGFGLAFLQVQSIRTAVREGGRAAATGAQASIVQQKTIDASSGAIPSGQNGNISVSPGQCNAQNIGSDVARQLRHRQPPGRRGDRPDPVDARHRDAPGDRPRPSGARCSRAVRFPHQRSTGGRGRDLRRDHARGVPGRRRARRRRRRSVPSAASPRERVGRGVAVGGSDVRPGGAHAGGPVRRPRGRGRPSGAAQRTDHGRRGGGPQQRDVPTSRVRRSVRTRDRAVHESAGPLLRARPRLRSHVAGDHDGDGELGSREQQPGADRGEQPVRSGYVSDATGRNGSQHRRPVRVLVRQ